MEKESYLTKKSSNMELKTPSKGKRRTMSRGSVEETSFSKFATISGRTGSDLKSFMFDSQVEVLHSDELNVLSDGSTHSSPIDNNKKSSLNQVIDKLRTTKSAETSPDNNEELKIKQHRRRPSLGKVNSFVKKFVKKNGNEEEAGEIMTKENLDALIDSPRIRTKQSLENLFIPPEKTSSVSENISIPVDMMAEKQRERSATVTGNIVTKLEKQGNHSAILNPATFNPPPLVHKKSEEEVLRDKFKKRRVIVDEIISTEESYIKSVQTAIKHYFYPMRSSILNGTKFVVDGKPMTVEQVHQIFNNIEMILQINETEVLPALIKVKESWNDHTSLIGPLFLKWAPLFKLYAEYSQKYDKGIHFVKKAEKSCSPFREWLDERRKNPNGTDLLPPLDQYIVTPIQRIPRYLLLLQQLQKNTPPEHQDFETLREATGQMARLAADIDASIQVQENFQKIYSIQESFVKGQVHDLVKPGRKFIKQGKVKVIKDATFKIEKFMLFLFNDVLVLSHPLRVGRVTVPGKYHYLKQIPTMQLFPDEDAGMSPSVHFPFPFRLKTAERDFLISTKTEMEKQEWIKVIHECRENELSIEGARISSRVASRPISEMTRIAEEAKKMEKIREIEQEKKKEEEEKRRKMEEDERNAKEAIRKASEVMTNVIGKQIGTANSTKTFVDIDSLVLQACRSNNVDFLKYFFAEIKPHLARDTEAMLQKCLTAAIKSDSKEALGILLNNGTNPNGFKDSVLTPLQLAVELNKTELAYELVHAFHCDVNKSIYSTLSPLQLAVRNQNLDLVKFFLKAEASVNAQDLLNGRTALHWAVETKNYDIVATLIDCGARMNVKDKLHGETPLHLIVRIAVTRKDLMLLCLLLDKDEKLPVDEKSLDMQRTGSLETVLHLAVSSGRERAGVVQLLLQYKPNLDLENAEGETVLELAEKRGYSKTWSILKKARTSDEISVESLSPYLEGQRRSINKIED